MAIDGVAPRAKMNQQRSRRFRSAQEAQEKAEEEERLREEWAKEGREVPPPSKEPFDSNVITPGTPFMDRLAVYLRAFVHKKLTSDPGWVNLVASTQSSHQRASSPRHPSKSPPLLTTWPPTATTCHHLHHCHHLPPPPLVYASWLLATGCLPEEPHERKGQTGPDTTRLHSTPLHSTPLHSTPLHSTPPAPGGLLHSRGLVFSTEAEEASMARTFRYHAQDILGTADALNFSHPSYEAATCRLLADASAGVRKQVSKSKLRKSKCQLLADASAGVRK